MPWWLVLILDFITSFIITAGGAISAAMQATKEDVPSNGTIIISCASGLIMASIQLRTRMSMPPVRTNGKENGDEKSISSSKSSS